MRLWITALTVCGLLLGTTHALAQVLVKPVEVVNLPAVQDVTGAVEVTNLPAVQDVNVVGGGADSLSIVLFDEQLVPDFGTVTLPPVDVAGFSELRFLILVGPLESPPNEAPTFLRVSFGIGNVADDFVAMPSLAIPDSPGETSVTTPVFGAEAIFELFTSGDGGGPPGGGPPSPPN